MGDTHIDPTDHSRTHCQHTGGSMIDTYFWPGLFLVAIGVVAFVGCVAAVAYSHSEWLMATALTAIVASVVGLGLVALERRTISKSVGGQTAILQGSWNRPRGQRKYVVVEEISLQR